MFEAKTERIKKLEKYFPKRIKQLEELLSGKTNVYIDYANVRPWSNKFNWNIDAKRWTIYI